MKHKIILLVILCLAAFLRLYGLNWDQSQHLHPDERFLTMVAGAMRWPKNMSEYLDTSKSTLNPHNVGFGFYVYGTYPTIFVKYIAEVLKKGDYVQLTLVGRALSAAIDTFTVFLVYLISFKLTKNKHIPILSAFFYTISVLPIQLSHFFAVEPYLNFFSLLTLYLLLRSHPLTPKSFFWGLTAGVSFALAAAAKITAVLIAPTILVFLLANVKSFNKLIIWLLIFFMAFFVVFRFTYPYFFTGINLNPKIIANWKELKSFDNPQGYFPPAQLWVGTTPLVYPVINLLNWGLGFPLGILSLVGLYLTLRKPSLSQFLLLTFFLSVFLYQGIQFSKAMRYFYPTYPLFAILAATGFIWTINRFKHHRLLASCTLLACASIWPLAFMSIYTRPHSRISASKWIYENIPSGANISCEHWDDCLPLNLPGYPGNGSYRGVEFPMYNPDTDPRKWSVISAKLSQIDYLILSSSRVYGSTLNAAAKFPQNKVFYHKLFSGSLGFTKVAEFSSRPNIPLPIPGFCVIPAGNNSYGQIAKAVQECPLPGLSFVDDYTDETFTVYDHPKVIIFKKDSSLSSY